MFPCPGASCTDKSAAIISAQWGCPIGWPSSDKLAATNNWYQAENPLLHTTRIVLINTSHPGNIGATARAMKNMGLSRLYLVQPKRYPDPEAVIRAASAADILDSAVVCESLDEALADTNLVVGTSARSRRIPWPLVSPREFAESLVAGEGGSQRESGEDNGEDNGAEVSSKTGPRELAVLFGREDRGLSNTELQRCSQHIHIPTSEEYSSLNIAMAVQLICYELRMAWLSVQADPAVEHSWDAPWASDAEKERFYVHLEETLVTLEFLDPSAPRQLMTRLRRLFGRLDLDQMEVNILRGILTSAQAAAKKSK